MEQFVVSWLLEIVGKKMDFRQYGGNKGNSISHYLIEFLNFILHQQENEATAVLACLVDFSKAFNRQDHSILVTKLSDMGVPGWLLRLVIAFLKNRTMKVKYMGNCFPYLVVAHKEVCWVCFCSLCLSMMLVLRDK